MKLTLRHYALIATMSVAGASFASADLDVYFSTDGSTQTGMTVGAVGTTFSIGVWARSANGRTVNSIEVCAGFGQSTLSNTNATDLDGKVGLGGASANASVTLGSLWANVAAPALRGFRGTGTRPFGVDANLGAAPIPSGTVTLSSTATKLFDISLKNLGIGAGQSYTIKIWDAGTGASATTYGNGVNPTAQYRPGTTEFRLTAVPEPGSFIALGLGAAALIARRRRSK